jgi:Zn-dependent alcohol dehydrogenase
MLASGRTHAASLIGLVVPLEKIAEAFNAVAQGRVLKAVVQPNA